MGNIGIVISPNYGEKRLVMHKETANILQVALRKDKWSLNSSEFDLVEYFDETKVQSSLWYRNGQFEGELQISAIDTLHFTGIQYYDGNGPVIESISYISVDSEIDEIFFPESSRKYLREIITSSLYENYNAEMYMQWSEDQSDMNDQDREDRIMGN